MKLLALDFDGVISNSAPEAFVVALRTYVDMRPGSGFDERCAQLLGPSVPSAARVRSDALYPGFLELMPLGNRAEDYAVVLRAIDEGREIRDQAAYDAFRAGCDPEWLRAYHRRFYRERADLASSYDEGWHAESWGTAIVSRLPFDRTAVRHVTEIGGARPALEAVVRAGDERLHVVVVHPARPGKGWRIRRRDAVLAV